VNYCGIIILIQLCLYWFNSFADVLHNRVKKNFNITKEFKIIDPDYDHDNICVYKFLDQQKSSYIVFIKDLEGNSYIVKQEKGKLLKNQFRSLCEALCAYIAYEISIPSHRVTILPAGVPFPGKFITKRIATLHTLVPGNTIRSLVHSEYAKLDLKQTTNNDIPFEKQGLNERTIFSMSLHPHLPYIVGLDTFIGNKDRNKANILYDDETDSFYAIDMSLMYDVFSDRQSVAHVACEQVRCMIEQHKKFTKKEQEALLLYRSVLQELVLKFPPKRMGDLLDNLLEESGLIGEKSSCNEKEVYALLNVYKQVIKQSYIDIKKLIYLLFILINN
jgi:hypothetical protein